MEKTQDLPLDENICLIIITKHAKMSIIGKIRSGGNSGIEGLGVGGCVGEFEGVRLGDGEFGNGDEE